MSNIEKKTAIKIALCLFIAIFLMTGSWRIIQHYFSLPDDSPIEELIESEIEEVTGLDVDLSNDSDEINPL